MNFPLYDVVLDGRSAGVAIALGLALIVSEGQCWKIGWIALAGGLTGAFAWALFHLLSDGMFTDVLELQIFRYKGKSGFEVFRVTILDPLGITTGIRWNLHEHARVFLYPFDVDATTWLATLAVAGQLLVWSSCGPMK